MTYTVMEASLDSGSPIELYEFSYLATYLRYTSSIETVIYNGQSYAPYTMKRGAIVNQASSIEQPLEITAFKDFPPAQLFRVQAPSAVLNLTVRRFHTMDPDNQFAAIWIGRVLNVSWTENNEVKVQCESDLASMKRLSLRRPYQISCPYCLYQRGCNVSALAHAITVTSFTASGREVIVPGLAGYPANYFAGGYFTFPSALTGITELFSIRSSSSGVMQLALTPFGVATAGAATFYPGCDHTSTVCETVFDNLDNYGGQLLIPGTNPFAGTQLF